MVALENHNKPVALFFHILHINVLGTNHYAVAAVLCRRIQQRIVSFIVRNSHVDEAELSRLMMETGELASDVGSVVGAEQAVSLGLCDEVGTLHDALEILHDMIDQRRSRQKQKQP